SRADGAAGNIGSAARIHTHVGSHAATRDIDGSSLHHGRVVPAGSAADVGDAAGVDVESVANGATRDRDAGANGFEIGIDRAAGDRNGAAGRGSEVRSRVATGVHAKRLALPQALGRDTSG